MRYSWRIAWLFAVLMALAAGCSDESPEEGDAKKADTTAMEEDRSASREDDRGTQPSQPPLRVSDARERPITDRDEEHRITMERLGTLYAALHQFWVDMGRMPSESEGLEVLIDQPRGPVSAKHWQGPYIGGPPDETVSLQEDRRERLRLLRDGWDRPIRFEFIQTDAGFNRVRVWSVGRNGIDEDGASYAPAEGEDGEGRYDDIEYGPEQEW